MNLPAPPVATTTVAPLFELDRATVVRGATRVLRDLSLSIPLGQHTAILGPNGCGKSTFIKLINRELYPLAREGDAPVKVFGLRRWNVNQLRNRLGVVTSDLTRDLQQMPQLLVEEAVVTGFFSSFVVPPHRQIDADMRARARRALADVHAATLADRQVAELSTGEMRRVLIARALVHEPEALLLDEPTAGLDLVARQHFLGLMRLLAQRGITLVLVTHHIEEIIPEIDRVLLLRDGTLQADGDRAAILTDAHLSHAFGGQVRVRFEGDVYSATVTHA
ncbi:ABC transporter ATP-binding protein [Pseudoxanthomonas sp.]|jgi:iron complex transport system ATP-binding protein|uniref:ABC transporter ATP-binding protein n=1 Tax=Pseudoxanthomonas sp. TaxID=1871049 RepID=UPI002E1389A3|nr:ATP-binding cassette domain-containing protein [Pseudoxanthomonas sp.]